MAAPSSALDPSDVDPPKALASSPDDAAAPPAGAKSSAKKRKNEQPLLRPGISLLYERQDYNSRDLREFWITEIESWFTFTIFVHHPEGKKNIEDPLTDCGCEPEGLSHGRTTVWLRPDCDYTDTAYDTYAEKCAAPDMGGGELPPFLLSRQVLSELRTGETLLWPEYPSLKCTNGDAVVRLMLKERTKATVLLNGKPQEMDVLVAEGCALGDKDSGIDLRVIDDAEWPVIVERREDGECYWKLLSIKTRRLPKKTLLDQISESSELTTKIVRAIAEAAQRKEDVQALMNAVGNRWGNEKLRSVLVRAVVDAVQKGTDVDPLVNSVPNSPWGRDGSRAVVEALLQAGVNPLSGSPEEVIAFIVENDDECVAEAFARLTEVKKMDGTEARLLTTWSSIHDDAMAVLVIRAPELAERTRARFAPAVAEGYDLVRVRLGLAPSASLPPGLLERVAREFQACTSHIVAKAKGVPNRVPRGDNEDRCFFTIGALFPDLDTCAKLAVTALMNKQREWVGIGAGALFRFMTPEQWAARRGSTPATDGGWENTFCKGLISIWEMPGRRDYVEFFERVASLLTENPTHRSVAMWVAYFAAAREGRALPEHDEWLAENLVHVSKAGEFEELLEHRMPIFAAMSPERLQKLVASNPAYAKVVFDELPKWKERSSAASPAR